MHFFNRAFFSANNHTDRPSNRKSKQINFQNVQTHTTRRLIAARPTRNQSFRRRVQLLTRVWLCHGSSGANWGSERPVGGAKGAAIAGADWKCMRSQSAHDWKSSVHCVASLMGRLTAANVNCQSGRKSHFVALLFWGFCVFCCRGGRCGFFCRRIRWILYVDWFETMLWFSW